MTSEGRKTYQDELAEVEQQVLSTSDLVSVAIDRAVEAVQHQDAELASQVIADDDRIDGRYLDSHQHLLTLLARQAPVATDLRLVAALLHVINNLERQGDLCVNIAKLVPLSGNEPPVHEGILERIAEMGSQGRRQLQQACTAFAERNLALAEDLVRQDDVIDRLNREIFALALEIGDDHDQREWGAHMMLIARHLERIGDNAVDIGEQIAFVVTGLFREFSDASHPSGTPAAQQ